MAIISFIAEAFNSIIYNLCATLSIFLQFNFTLFSSILHYACLIHKNALEIAVIVCTAIQCCYNDFVLFLCEVKSIISFITNSVSTFSFKWYSQASYGFSVILDYAHLIWTNITEIISFVCDIGCFIYSNVIYLSNLLLTSVLLILQAGPNFIIFLGEISFLSTCYIFHFLKHFILSLLDDIHHMGIKSGEAIYSVPVKAYFGALLFIVIFYQYHLFVNILKAYVTKLGNFFKQIGVCVQLCLSISLKPVNSLFMFIFNKLKSMTGSYNEQETDVFYDASPDVFCEPRQSIIIKCLKSAKNALNKSPLMYRRQIEEQIQTLQKELNAEREKNLCVICFDRPKNIILYPCRHLCVCQECSSVLQMGHQGCPLCRHSIEYAYHVYT